MSSIKISELSPLQIVTSDDFFPLVDSASLTTFRVDVTSFGEWMRVSGSCLSASYSPSISSSWASHSLSASYAPPSGVSAFADSALSASWASSSLSSSYALTSSYAITASFAITASNSISSSYSITSSYSVSSSYARSASHANVADSSSYAATASYALGSGGDTVPIGTIIQFAATSIPNNWLECNGDAKLITSYQDLYNAIQTTAPTATFGYKCNSDGTANPSGLYFKLPDLRGEFVRGFDNGRGIDSTRVFASSQADAVGPASLSVTGNLNNVLNLDDAGTKCYLASSSDINTTNVQLPNANTTLPTAIAEWTSPSVVFPSSPNSLQIRYANLLTYIYSKQVYKSPLIITSASTSGTETRPRNIALVYCIKYSNAFNYANLTGVTLAGDVTGNYTATTVGKIQNVTVDSTAPTSGQYLKYDGTKWTPSTISSTVSNTSFQTCPERAGGFIYNNELYLSGYSPQVSNKSMLYKINLSTRAVTYLTYLSNDYFRSLRGHVFINPNNSEPYFIASSDASVLVYRISSNTVTYTNTSQGQLSYSQIYPVDISWGTSITTPSLVIYTYGGNNLINSAYKKSLVTSGNIVTNTALNLRNTISSTAFNNLTYNSDDERIALLDYNNHTSKKRYYCITVGSGLLHIFKHVSGDINSSFSVTDIQYEKTIPINSTVNTDAGWYNQFSIQYDPSTGEEIGILKFQSSISSVQTGFVEFIPWQE